MLVGASCVLIWFACATTSAAVPQAVADTLFVLAKDSQNDGRVKDAVETLAAQNKQSVSAQVKEIQAELPGLATAALYAEAYLTLAYLLDNGWDWQTPNSDGQSLLEVAVKHGNDLYTRLLLRSGAKDYVANTSASNLAKALKISARSNTLGKLREWSKAGRDSRTESAIPEDFEQFSTGHSSTRQGRDVTLAPKKASPGQVIEPADGYFLMNIPFATNRTSRAGMEPTTAALAATFFRDLTGTSLKYGFARVSMPQNHKRGKLESPSMVSFVKDPKKHVVLMSIKTMPSEEFFAGLKSLRGEDKDVFLYIHGFNVDFAYAAKKTAQMIFDMKLNGISLFYSWPARPVRVPIPQDFREDVGRAEEAAPMLSRFLSEMKTQFPNNRVHIVAHSLGSRVLCRAIRDMDASKRSFGQIVLAAPAIDADLFRKDFCEELLKACDRLSILSSSDDLALRLQNLAEDPKFTFPLGLWTSSKAAVFKSEKVFHFDFSPLGAVGSLEHSTYSEIGQGIDLVAELIRNAPSKEDIDQVPFTRADTREDYFSRERRGFWKILE